LRVGITHSIRSNDEELAGPIVVPVMDHVLEQVDELTLRNNRTDSTARANRAGGILDGSPWLIPTSEMRRVR
jgi:hypothetical protein